MDPGLEHEELASYHGTLNIAGAADALHGEHEDPACQLVPGELLIGVMQGSPNLRVINGQTLAYEQGTTTWVNHLRSRCPAIEPYNTVIVEPQLGTQYCSGDHIRGLEPGAIIPGPICFLGEWVPYRKP